MRNLVNRFWLMCCSVMLLTTYMLCFGSAVTFNDSANLEGMISISRNVVVETAPINDASKDGSKETIKEDKKLNIQKSVFLPLLPVLVSFFNVIKYRIEKKYSQNILAEWISAFIPSLGANAPPFAHC